MSEVKTSEINLHLDKARFISAIEYTAAETGFDPGLIEKDYFCTVILKFLSSEVTHPLIFKGGTLLAKVHAGYYRLSEDLDYSIPVSMHAKRNERRALIKPVKAIIDSIESNINGISVSKSLKGSNESRQYNAELSYRSALTGNSSTVLVEIGLREELIQALYRGSINTLLLDPFKRSPILSPFEFNCLSQEEAYAEKLRAAMTREKLAIRDFYDLHYARHNELLDFTSSVFVEILKKKLTLPDVNFVDFDERRVANLKQKIATELNRTLNITNDVQFDLPAIIKWINDYRERYLAD